MTYITKERNPVIANLKEADLTGVATGQFRDPVKLIYVEHITDIEEAMEVQISIFYNLRQVT